MTSEMQVTREGEEAKLSLLSKQLTREQASLVEARVPDVSSLMDGEQATD